MTLERAWVWNDLWVCLEWVRNGSRMNSEWIRGKLCMNSDWVLNGIWMHSEWILNRLWTRNFLPMELVARRTGAYKHDFLSLSNSAVRLLCWEDFDSKQTSSRLGILFVNPSRSIDSITCCQCGIRSSFPFNCVDYMLQKEVQTLYLLWYGLKKSTFLKHAEMLTCKLYIYIYCWKL